MDVKNRCRRRLASGYIAWLHRRHRCGVVCPAMKEAQEWLAGLWRKKMLVIASDTVVHSDFVLDL